MTIIYIKYWPILLVLPIFFISVFLGQYFSKVFSGSVDSPNILTTHNCLQFPDNLLLEESSEEVNSEDECWWLNSGAFFLVRGGIGGTIVGPLHISSKWVQLYNLSDPKDTEQGMYPQNIFRL